MELTLATVLAWDKYFKILRVEAEQFSFIRKLRSMIVAGVKTNRALKIAATMPIAQDQFALRSYLEFDKLEGKIRTIVCEVLAINPHH